MKRFFVVIVVTSLVALFLAGCGAVRLAGDYIRGEQKDVDIVLSPDVTPSMLQQKKNIGVNVNGVSAQTGQLIYARGTGTTNASIYSDMLTKEFMRAGFIARTITEDISETSSKERFSELEQLGIEIALVGNMNISTTTSSTSFLTGGDYSNTGVLSFTVKGIDIRTGAILFIISSEYGKAKTAGEVTKDIGQIYRDIVSGKAKDLE